MRFHEQKLDRILELLETKPYWDTAELAAQLSSSRSTVQRCLRELHDMGLLLKIHGGVKRLNLEPARPVTIDERREEDLPAKQAICSEAVKMIGQSGMVYLDAGTTIFPMTQLLKKSSHANVEFITNDITIAVALSHSELKHVLVGGQIHTITQALSGPHTQMLLGYFSFDLCFVSADCIDFDANVSCSVSMEAILKRLVIERSERRVLLATAHKWKKQAGSLIANLKEFDCWIADTATPDIRKACARYEVALIEAGASDSVTTNQAAAGIE
jgi:DeoR family fructose operon transcriptional repressor